MSTRIMQECGASRGSRASRRWILSWVVAAIFAAGPVQAGEKVPVLIYHQIVEGAHAGGETSISSQRFAEQMRYLHEAGYTTVSTRALVAHMRGDIELPKNRSC